MKKIILALALAASCTALPSWAKDVPPGHTSEVLVEEHNVPTTIADRIEHALKSVLPGTKLPTPLVLAIMKIESGFNPKAKGGGGAAGLMQVMPGVHLEKVRDISDKPNLTVNGAHRELLDVDVNVEAGVAILADCYKKHNGDAGKAAECYNGYPRDGGYRNKVMRAYRDFSASLGFSPK